MYATNEKLKNKIYKLYNLQYKGQEQRGGLDEKKWETLLSETGNWTACVAPHIDLNFLLSKYVLE